MLAPTRGTTTDPAIIEELRRRLGIEPAPMMPGRMPSGDINAPRVDLRDAAMSAGPSRGPVKDVTKYDLGDLGTPPPAPTPEPQYLKTLEGVSRDVSRNAPVPDMSNATVTQAGKIEGVSYPTRNPELPIVSHEMPMDSSVLPAGELPPSTATTTPANDFSGGLVHKVERQPGESEAAFNRRRRETRAEVLRSASPYSKITVGNDGVVEDAPIKPHGLKQRGLAGLSLMMRNMGQGSRFGLPGAAGAGLVSLLTGLFAPGLAAKFNRADEISAADTASKEDDQAAFRESQTALRQAQLEEIQSAPSRRDAQSKEAARDNLRQVWEHLTDFDPVNNPEHKKLQDQAAALGDFLPSKSAKPTRGTRTGLLVNAKTAADTEGNRYYVDEATGQPIPDPSDPSGRTPLYAARAQPKPETPDLTGNYTARAAELKKLIDDDESAMRTHTTNITTKDRLWEQKARVKMEAAQKDDPNGDTVLGKRSLKDWVELVKQDDPDYQGADSKYDYSVRTRNELEDRIKENRQELRQIESAARTQETKPRTPARGAKAGGAYAGRSFSMQAVGAWAAAHNMTPEAARTLFEREGAKVQ
jgi:hypothetical protein